MEVDTVSLFLVYGQSGSCDELMHAFTLSEGSVAVLSSSDQCRRYGLSIDLLHVIFDIGLHHSDKGISQTWVMCGSEIVMSSDETVE